MTAIDRLRLATAFLTRFPVRAPAGAPASDIASALTFFPVVGLGLGCAIALLVWGASGVLSPALAAALAVGALAAATGALHLDGLADLFDGLGGGRGDREQTLDLMRDGRIGAHGATALVLLLLVKVLALADVVTLGSMCEVVAFPVVGRWIAVLLVGFFPYARPAGLGRAFADHVQTRDVVMASLVAAGVVLWGGADSLCGMLVAAVAGLALGAWLTRRLGGLTGDAYGAAIEIAETAFLVGALAARASPLDS